MVFQIRIVSEDLVSYMLGDLLVDTSHAFLWGGGHFVPLFGLFLFMEFLYSFGGFLAGYRLWAGLFADSGKNVVFTISIFTSCVFLSLSPVLILDPDKLLVFPLVSLLFQCFNLIFKLEKDFFDILIIDIIFDILCLSFFEKVE